MSEFTLHHGDCIEVMRGMASDSVDAIVTDPPYELGFMGKGWDKTGIANDPVMWAEALRVLKPGGHLLAFSGSRTYHRMVCAIEDAGFEVRDQIMWLYGSGFPKSLNVAKAIESGGGRPEDIRRMQLGADYEPSGRGRANYDHGAGSAMDAGATAWTPATEAARQWQGWGTALKPAHEPICVARKPLVGTVAANVLAHGTGALNIDGCRVEPTGESRERVGEASQDRRYTDAGGTNFAATPGIRGGDPAGRWPANVIHDGSDEVLSAFPQAKGQQGEVGPQHGAKSSVNVYGDYGPRGQFEPRGDTGSAARFFYCAKASRSDRNEGLVDPGPQFKKGSTLRDAENLNATGDRKGNFHPTVKPTDLMRYLVRLVTPPGGTVMDMFMGSGSTGKACALEGFRFVGIDMTEEYVRIAQARIDASRPKQEAASSLAGNDKDQSDLFGSAA